MLSGCELVPLMAALSCSCITWPQSQRRLLRQRWMSRGHEVKVHLCSLVQLHARSNGLVKQSLCAWSTEYCGTAAESRVSVSHLSSLAPRKPAMGNVKAMKHLACRCNVQLFSQYTLRMHGDGKHPQHAAHSPLGQRLRRNLYLKWKQWI